MKESEVRLIQKYLVDDDLYSGKIDGKRGPKTNKAIAAALTKRSPEGSFSSPNEFQFVVDMLRNEKSVWWDEATQRLYVHNEPVGEGE